MVQAAIPGRAVEMARQRRREMPNQLERFHCAVGAEVGRAEKGTILAGMHLRSFAVIMLFGRFPVLFYYFKNETTRKSDATLEHIKRTHKCAFEA
jgi:hypothetical protein